MTLSDKSNKLMVSINGKVYQPPKKILSKNEILELAGIDDTNVQLYMLDEQGKKIKVDTDEGVELKSDMRFLTSYPS